MANAFTRERRRRIPAAVIMILAAFAIPLLIAIVPIFGPIVAAVALFTGAMLGANTTSTQLNALLPWFALASVLVAGFIVAVAFGVNFSAQLKGR